VSAALSIAPFGIPRLHEVAMNWRVASFAAALALVVTALGNAVPTFRAGRTPIAGALKDGAAVSGSRSGRLRAGLVAAEIAAAVMLLVGAGLLVRTFAELQRVDVGFDTSNLLVLRITPDAARYRTRPQTTDYYRRVIASLREVPAIASVAAITSLPMSTIGSEFTRPFWPEHAGPESRTEASVRMATPDYFGTLRLPVMAGREFTDADDADAPRVAIVNQKLANSAWGNDNPIGRKIVLDYQEGAYPYEVVGVVRDDRHDGPRSEPVPEIYIPHAQNPYLVLNVIARTTLDPMVVAQTARAYALRVDPDQPVHSVTTMDQLLGDAVQLDRFAMLLITLFAVGGLVTAAGGVYALLAYTVAQRRREIALRMALGASPRRVARSIVMESLALAAAGGAIGLLGAAAGSRFASTMLFGVAPQDPVTLVTSVAVLIVVVIAASWLPARRASLIDPSRAMRI
jgi:putative ABC transport system permease protein